MFFDHLPCSFCGCPPLSTLLGLSQEERLPRTDVRGYVKGYFSKKYFLPNARAVTRQRFFRITTARNHFAKSSKYFADILYSWLRCELAKNLCRWSRCHCRPCCRFLAENAATWEFPSLRLRCRLSGPWRVAVERKRHLWFFLLFDFFASVPICALGCQMTTYFLLLFVCLFVFIYSLSIVLVLPAWAPRAYVSQYFQRDNHAKTGPFKIQTLLSGFQLVFDKMAAICRDLNGWASSLQIPFEIQTTCNPTCFGPFIIPTRSDFRSCNFVPISNGINQNGTPLENGMPLENRTEGYH